MLRLHNIVQFLSAFVDQCSHMEYMGIIDKNYCMSTFQTAYKLASKNVVTRWILLSGGHLQNRLRTEAVKNVYHLL